MLNFSLRLCIMLQLSVYEGGKDKAPLFWEAPPLISYSKDISEGDHFNNDSAINAECLLYVSKWTPMCLSKCVSERANKFTWPVSTSFLDFIFSIGINSNILFCLAFFSSKIKRKYFDKCPTVFRKIKTT
ncbi:protocadherin-8 [Platysternon megacephalum]|uniref:Protocadherin-8 n=1 Tax=Platysternon megacephalum TaxID=55544 RepID=A0A4D9F6Q6_9SAUR|nr:protocadherin-8 [Platysternon megacephalum]